MAQRRSLKDRLAETPAGDDEPVEEEEIEEVEENPEVEEESEIEEEVPQEPKARAGTKADYKAALKWAIEKIGHPSEQWGNCTAHGRVPFTHQCGSYTNVEYAHAVELAGLADDEEDSG